MAVLVVAHTVLLLVEEAVRSLFFSFLLMISTTTNLIEQTVEGDVSVTY